MVMSCTDTDVDGLGRIVVFEKEQQRIGQVVHEEELPARQYQSPRS